MELPEDMRGGCPLFFPPRLRRGGGERVNFLLPFGERGTHPPDGSWVRGLPVVGCERGEAISGHIIPSL